MELKNDNFDGGSSFFRLFGFTTPDIVGSFIGPNISWRCIFRDIQEDSRIRILHGQTLTVLVCPALPLVVLLTYGVMTADHFGIIL